MNFVDKDLLSVQEARILMERAGESGAALAQFPQERLDQILNAMLESVKEQLAVLARMAAEETGYGNSQDKYRKDHFFCRVLTERMKNMRCVGILSEEPASGIAAVGVPIGVIVALCPACDPVAVTICNAAMAVKSGNAVVFAPHPRAEDTTRYTVKILAEAAVKAGLPEGAISCLDTVAFEGVQQLLRHSAASIILNTGVPELLEYARHSGKPLIYGGMGPSPVFIERSADIVKAVKDIMFSRSFDFGITAASEQYVVVDRAVVNQVQKEIIRTGGYFMSIEEEGKLAGLLYGNDGSQDPETIGKSAVWLSGKAGFTVPDGTRILVSGQRYISDQNSYAKALQCPVMVFYIENDWMRACEKCMGLLEAGSFCHTLAIHSHDKDIIRQFALKKPVGRVLVNTPAAMGALGATTNLFPTMTLGVLSAGQGVTSDNVSPMNFVYLRKVAHGVTDANEWIAEEDYCEERPPESSKSAETLEAAAVLRLILEQLGTE